MSVEEFFDIQEFAASKTPKEKIRFTYWDVIKFAELYHREVSEPEYKHKNPIEPPIVGEIRKNTKSW